MRGLGSACGLCGGWLEVLKVGLALFFCKEANGNLVARNVASFVAPKETLEGGE